MRQLLWMLLQAAIAAPVYYYCTAELDGKGLGCRQGRTEGRGQE
jgi:hypothetical protein